MKQIITIIALSFIGITAYGQTKSVALQVRNAAGTVKTLDTLVNTDTGFLYVTFNGSYDLQFKATITKISGTVAGAAIVFGSNDGTNWFALESVITGTGITASQYQEDTATITDATASYWWNLPHGLFQYYRVRIISSGTSTYSYTGTAYYRPD